MRSTLTARRSFSAAALAAFAGLALPALGQISWNNAGGGAWGNVLNWNPANVPNTTAEDALIALAGSYTVATDAGYSLRSLTLTNPTGVLHIADGTNLRLADTGIANNSTITINTPAGGSNTFLQCLASLPLSGSGQIILNANAGNLDTAYLYFNGGGEVMTQALGHTIRGSGNIYVSLNNQGLVSADQPGRTLQLLQLPKTNSSTMQAVGGGILQINSISVNNAGGVIMANGGTVNLLNASISGGGVATTAGSTNILGTTTFDGVLVSGPVSVLDGGQLRIVNNDITNNGIITLGNGASGSNTYIRFLNSRAFLGSGGAIVLDANPANLDTAYLYFNGGGEVFTNSANHVVRGSGRIYVNTTNDGLIEAHLAGRTLELVSQPKTNNAVMRSIGGGHLAVIGVAVNQSASGQIVGTSSPLTFNNATINAGAVSTSGPGLATILGTSNWNGVAFSGQAFIADGHTLRTNAGGITNNGTITINSPAGGSGSRLQLLASAPITGSGTIVLDANPLNLDTAYLYYNGGGEVLSHAATHTIRGSGNIYVNLVNNGLIQADFPGRTLQLFSQPKTNNNLIRATNGGTLAIGAITVNNAAGTIATSGASTLFFNNASINGGNINTTAGGLASINGTTNWNGVTFAGAAGVNDAQVLRTNAAGFTNNGTITINPTAGGSGTYLQFLNSATLTGSGSVVLNANPANLDTAYLLYNGGAEVFTNTPSHTVRGTGNIYVNTVNNGLIQADVPGRTLQLFSQPKTNNSLISAVNGSNLAISGITVSNAAGTIAAAASTLSFNNASINGGNINTTAGGLATINGTSNWNGVTLAGQAQLSAGSVLRTNATGIINHGTITINPTAAGATTYFQCLASTTLSGTGSVVLNANPANFDTAYFIYNGGGEVLTNGPDHTIAGRGRIYCRTANQGTIAPGSAPGISDTIELRNLFTCAPSSTFSFDVGGDTEFDRISTNAAITLDGTLRVQTANAYTPGYGTTFDIILHPVGARTGQFTAFDGLGFVVSYLPDRVRLTAVCDADYNLDGNANQDDIDALINDIAQGADSFPPNIRDYNRDGNADQDDVDLLINVVAGGACN